MKGGRVSACWQCFLRILRTALSHVGGGGGELAHTARAEAGDVLADGSAPGKRQVGKSSEVAVLHAGRQMRERMLGARLGRRWAGGRRRDEQGWWLMLDARVDASHLLFSWVPHACANARPACIKMHQLCTLRTGTQGIITAAFAVFSSSSKPTGHI